MTSTTFKILDKSEVLNENNEKTVTTKVEYLFDEKDTITVDISHFNPKSDDDILLGINNRSVSERRKLYGEIKL
jgi:hypothetical protein